MPIHHIDMDHIRSSPFDRPYFITEAAEISR
jgi:hypothetical protein